MRIRRIDLARFRLALRVPLATGAGRIETREGVLVSLHTSGAIAGFGETTPIAGFGMETVEASWEALIALAPHLVGEDVRDLDALCDGIEAAAPKTPSARAALDAALHDVSARAAGRCVAAWLAARAGRRARRNVSVNALLSEREPGRLGAEASRAVAAGFRTLKLKVAAGGVEEDVARVIAVRAAVGAQPRLRLDANGGWKEDEALLALGRLAPLGIEMLEQPVDANDVLALARLRGASPVRIAADESAAGAERAERVIVLGAADVICLKLGATGGLRAALRIADRARSAGIAVFVTSGLDGAVARAAALQLAAALPGRLPACGLATGVLLRDDLATCAAPSRGALALPRCEGLGVVPTALSRVAVGPSLAFEAEGG